MNLINNKYSFFIWFVKPGGTYPTYGYPGAISGMAGIPNVAPVVMVPNVTGRTVPVFVSPQTVQQPTIEQPPPVQPITDEDVKQVQEMFPNIDVEVIRSVFEVNRGNKQVTINSLLQMSEQ